MIATVAQFIVTSIAVMLLICFIEAAKHDYIRWERTRNNVTKGHWVTIVGYLCLIWLIVT